MECGRKICIGSFSFSHIYISELLHDKTKVHRPSNLFEVILFLGKHNTEDVGSYSFSQKYSIQGPKKDQGKMKHNHLIIYETNRWNVHITADRDLTTVHFEIPLDVYDFFVDDTPRRDKKWAFYNKTVAINTNESKYVAYRLEFTKPKNRKVYVPD